MKTNKTTRTLSTWAMGAALASQQGMTELGIEKEISLNDKKSILATNLITELQNI
jgi:hypothetical protein